ncbi:allantoate amidohydrolase [Ktedonosporobacter rubrisoli]|uniref:Allantoate amidohydrolase n=1 Tax=Ktedonosporobacter rubrisoli TaxID=2509675 RepID=A0A4P6JT66_KTERU|nr:allantoate amidohydrolase [Ktedonosporobacter rubrisoli]QBD78769.1 allantoate amidohydrolase [Ktedonosporobacter rubrisoli]
MNSESSASTVMQRCEILGSYSEESGRLTRRFATPPMSQVNETVATWMQAAGMSVRQDQIGNLIGRYAAQSKGASTFLLGSHLDTVYDAGKYDGPLGVMVALACVERLYQRQLRLPFAIEILGFADEEGLRYHSAYLGSSAFAGTFDPAILQYPDNDGISMATALRNFGGDPEQISEARRSTDDLLGYCEVHIEQGPVLESLNLPVGIVTAIAGQNRFNVTFTGEAGHAGTVPMQLRRDALCAAAEFIVAVESYARSIPEMVATVGQLELQPGASNVIPGQVIISLDVRHKDDSLREQACRLLQERSHSIAKARHVACQWEEFHQHGTIPCSQHLSELLSKAVSELKHPVVTLPSGAGHDGAMISTLTDIAMLFVRCKGGISHNPAEAVTKEDVAVAIDALERFLLLLAQEKRQP